MKNETSDGPWKVVSCNAENLEEILNDLVAGGYLVHSMHPAKSDRSNALSGKYSTGFTVCGIDQAFVQGVNILTEEQAKDLKEKLEESNTDTCKV